MPSCWAMGGSPLLRPATALDCVALTGPLGLAKPSVRGRGRQHHIGTSLLMSSALAALRSDYSTHKVQQLQSYSGSNCSASGRALSSAHLLRELQLCIDQGDLEQALQKIQLLIDSDRAAVGRDEACAVVQGLCRTQQFRRAWRLHKSLSSISLHLSRGTYWLLVQTALQVRQPQQALEVFRYMQELHKTFSPVMWCELIDGLARRQQRGARSKQLPFELWRELRASTMQLDARSYVSGMNACVVAQRMDEAQNLLADMRCAGFSPNVRCFNILLKGHAQCHDIPAMQETFAVLKAEGLQPTMVTYNTMLNGFVVAKQLTQARQLMQEAQEDIGSLNLQSYTTMVKGYVSTGHLDAAMEVLRHMQRVHVSPNVVTYANLIQGFAKQGNASACHSLCTELRANGIPPNQFVFNILLGLSLAESNLDLQAAWSVVQDMAEQGLAPDSTTIHTLMQALLPVMPSAIPGLFRQLLKGGLAPSAPSYTMLVTALTRMGRPKDAVRAFHALQAEPSLDLEAPAITAGVGALASDGRAAEAEALLLRHASGGVPNVRSWGALLADHAHRRSLPLAAATLRRFCKLGGAPDERMLSDIVRLCLELRDHRYAAQVVALLEKANVQVDRARLRVALHELNTLQPVAPRLVERAHTSNEHIERFKFWVGLPNKYYPVEEWRDSIEVE